MSSSRDLFTPTYHASYALVIGIDQYQHLPPLGTAVHGARDVAGHLRDNLGFTVTELYDSRSNREKILRWFSQLNAHPDDRVIFYFAGHGITQNIKNRSKGFLALANSDGYWNSLAIDEILDEAEALPAKHVLYLLDACFSGLALRGRAADFGVSRTLDYLLTRPVRYAITAGGDEVVDDDAAGEYSLFTYVLLQAFCDKTLQADGMLRAKEVGLFIEENVSAHRRSRALPNHGYLHGSGDGDFIFTWQSGPRLPVNLEMALQSDLAEVRWGAVAALIHIACDEGDENLVTIAKDRLKTLSRSDPDNRVCAAAQSFFDDEDALRSDIQEGIRQAEADAFLENARQKQEEAARIAREADEQLLQARRRVEEEKKLKEATNLARQKAHDQALSAREITPVPPIRRQRPPEEVVLQAAENAAKKPLKLMPFAIGGGIIVVALVVGVLAIAGVFAHILAKAGVSHNNYWIPHTEVFKNVEMALVPKGCFKMGSMDGDPDERPVHEVCFEKPFWIDVTEVTNGQFVELKGQASRPSAWTDADFPRQNVTWEEANAFCEKRDGRLPTEAEWEYAARGPDELVYPWGNEHSYDHAVWRTSQPATVASKENGKSWIGAYDLSGNVWEFVYDWYDAYPSGRQVDPKGPEVGYLHIVRGGGWQYDTLSSTFFVRTTRRTTLYLAGSDNTIGFRCARSY